MKVTTLYQPPALPARCSYGITDDQHSPYSRESAGCYARAYCGYMALHLADTAPPGTAWTFTPELRLQRVGPDQVSPCRLSNKASHININISRCDGGFYQLLEFRIKRFKSFKRNIDS